MTHRLHSLVKEDAVYGKPLWLDAVFVVALLKVMGVVGARLAAMVCLLEIAAVLERWRLVLVPAQLEDAECEVLMNLELTATEGCHQTIILTRVKGM